MKKITARKLKLLGACQEQVDNFKELFPSGTVVTVELCVLHAQTFNWNWAAQHLLSAPAWAEYDRVEASAFAQLYIKEACK